VEPARIIVDNFDNSKTCFVFPSELTARFWAKAALRRSHCNSVLMTRFLSWDQFKERCLSYPLAGRPVNRAVRLLFLYEQLRRNSRSPFLAQIVPQRYAGDSVVFLEPLQRLLPVLNRIRGIRGRWPEFSLDRLADLETLYSTYRDFLKGSGLYEPSYRMPLFSPADNTYLLFYPELIEDYAEFAGVLTERIETVAVPPALRENTAVQVFQTLPEEIRAAVRRIAEMVDGGVDSGQIALTAGRLEELEPLLRREAHLFDLPLQIHLGKPLCEFPQVAMLFKAFAAAESAFSLESMKALLMCGSIPWKQRKLCRSLLRLALDGRIAGNTASTDFWALSLKTAQRNGNPRRLPLSRLSGFYLTLNDHLVRIASAGTFAGLKAALVAFTAAFLDMKRLSEEELRIFQFSMDTLEELARAAELVSVSSGPVFRLWWLYLRQRLYVPGRYDPGIPVYPFRVSGGMQPEHHFVINASQAATSHTLRRYPFLKLHEEQGLPDVQRDLSALHLRLYSHSGKNVTFSYSHRDFRRSNLPPPSFLTRGVSLIESTAGPEDAYERERKAWVDGSPFPLHSLQKAGYASAAVGALAPKQLDGTAQLLRDGGLIRSLQEPLRDAEGRLRISATALEHFGFCPFEFLFEHLLHVRAEEYEPVMIDPLELGKLLHRVAERLFDRSQADPLQPELFDDAWEPQRRRLHGIVSQLCSDYRRKNPTLLAPVAAELERRVSELALAFLEIDLRQMSGERVESTEARLQAPLADGGAVLVGHIDRINRNPGGFTLIDYKKKHVPGRAELFSEQAPSLQMPFYIHLMEQNGLPVTRAAFYSFEKKRYQFVIGGPRASLAGQEEVRRAVERLEQRVQEMLRRIDCGDFRVGSSHNLDCSRCRLEAICRHRYSAAG
jgi:RecB family exonuclease